MIGIIVIPLTLSLSEGRWLKFSGYRIFKRPGLPGSGLKICGEQIFFTFPGRLFYDELGESQEW